MVGFADALPSPWRDGPGAIQKLPMNATHERSVTPEKVNSNADHIRRQKAEGEPRAPV